MIMIIWFSHLITHLAQKFKKIILDSSIFCSVVNSYTKNKKKLDTYDKKLDSNLRSK